MMSSLQILFPKVGSPKEQRRTSLTFWEQNETQLPEQKIIDYIAVPINSETRSTVERNCSAQNLTDHWPVLTQKKLPERKGQWHHRNSYGFQERMEARNRK